MVRGGSGAIASLTLDDVSLAVRQFQLGPLSLALEPGEVVAVLGPSGAGKTVLLETIAGFYQPARGRIVLNGRVLNRLPPERRGVALIPQDYALFPQLTVAENVRFGLRYRPAGPHSVETLLGRLNLLALAARRPDRLSGGERQRVALARALAIRAELLLLDEPLAALDAPTRDALGGELRRLLTQFQLPAIYVTHDQAEALALADRVAVLYAGRFRQVAPPLEVWRRPSDRIVARLVGMNELGRATVARRSSQGGQIAFQGGLIDVERPLPDQCEVTMLARPEEIELIDPDVVGDDTRASLRLAGTVTEVTFRGVVEVRVNAGLEILVRWPWRLHQEHPVAPGQPVWLRIRPEALHWIAD